MGFTIKTISDFEDFKHYPTQPLCYVYYKVSLMDVYYVGYTIQNGYKYLKNHHKMKRIDDIIKNYSIQIYTKYDEDSLIKLFKPKLNKIYSDSEIYNFLNFTDEEINYIESNVG